MQSIIEQAQQNYAAQGLANCSDLTYHISNQKPVALSNGGTCGDILNITLHMAWSWSQYGSVYSSNNIGFANCFHEMAPRHNALNCSDLRGNACCLIPNYAGFTNADNKTLDFYVAWNMNDFQQWSVVYYTAMFDGGFLAGTQVWNTTISFEHLKSADVKVEVLLAVLTLALGLISPSGWAAKIQATLRRRNRPRMSPSATKYPLNTFYVPHNNRQGSLTTMNPQATSTTQPWHRTEFKDNQDNTLPRLEPL